MKTRPILRLIGFCLLHSAFCLSALAQGTAFTYQGRLNDGANPASGIYDLRFTIYAFSGGGVPAGGAVTATATAISNGLFTVTLDFGTGVFTGAPRWLEIAVRTNGAGAFATLAPRQPLTATPYAVRALEAGSMPAGSITGNMLVAGSVSATHLAPGAVTAAALAPGAVSQLGSPDGSPLSAVQVNTNGLVGVGTNSPGAGLHVTASQTFLNSELLAVRRDQSGGYTNLAGAGAVAVEGNLAVVAGFHDGGVTLMDLANPANPLLRLQIRDGEGVFTNLAGASGVALKPGVLAVAGRTDNAVTLISVTNPSVPVKLAELRDGLAGWNELLLANSVAINGNLLAIAAIGDSAVTLADIANPAAPIKRVEIKDGLFGFTNLAGAGSVALSGNLLAIGAVTDDTVTLVDVSDPANPVKRAELRDGVSGYNALNGVAGVALSGNLLAVAAGSDSAVTLVDVSNPSSPVKLMEWVDGVNAGSLASVQSVAFSGNRLAASSSIDNAVTVFDVSNPSSPVIVAVARQNVGGFNDLERPTGVTFAGTNLLVAAESSSAVSLLRLVDREAGLAVQERVGIGTTEPAGALHVVGDVVVEHANWIELNTTRFQAGTATAASGNSSTALGYATTASGDSSTALGSATTASGNYSTALGSATTASGSSSTAMGSATTASGSSSTAMGYESQATNDFTIAAGRGAIAGHYGSIVLTDGNAGSLVSSANHQFTARASGGYRLFSNSGATIGVSLAASGNAWASVSDRARKKDIRPLDGRAVLDKLAALPLSTWHYDFESADDAPHLGPMAQDFKAAFYPGRDDKTITTLEFDGVALAAIQGLNQKLEQKLKQKETELAELATRLEKLERLLSAANTKGN